MRVCLLAKENTFHSREPTKGITHLKWQGLTQGYIYKCIQKKYLLTKGVRESSLNPEEFPWVASHSQERSLLQGLTPICSPAEVSLYPSRV